MKTFKGFLRGDGSIGIRNHILVLPTVCCANSVVEAIGRLYPDVITVPHVYGCTFDPYNNEEVTNTFIGLGSNPNVGAVLLVSLGCETINLETVEEGIKKSGKPVESIVIQKCGGTPNAIEIGVDIVNKFKKYLSNTKKMEAPLSKLIVGTECGASDSYSGLSANPALGYTCDKLVDLGSTVILTEITELVGAENILKEQCINKEIARQLMECIKETEDYEANIGHNQLADISPGNIEGGLTTIEEKSLGCIKKCGSRKIKEVLEYGEKPKEQGLVVMDAPGHDIESMIAMAAGGAQLNYFTTGRGTPVGCCITPVIKISSNSETFKGMKDNIDINAGGIIEGKQSISEVGEEIFEYTLDVINGKETKSEKLKCREFAIRRKGTNCYLL